MIKALLLFTFLLIGPLCAKEDAHTVEIQKYIDEAWRANRTLLDKLDAYSFQPRLHLYSNQDKATIDHYEDVGKKICFQIAFTERLADYCRDSADLSEVDLQILELRISHALNNSLLKRKQQHFMQAMQEIEHCFALIKDYELHYEQKIGRGAKTPDFVKGLAYYHKGKIHRMLAGFDLDNLNQMELAQCESAYLTAFELCPDAHVIISSLGYLYNDMQKHEKALPCHLKALDLFPNFPDYIHGLAWGYYCLEHQNSLLGLPVNALALHLAEEAFEQSIEIFHKYKTENSRVFHDYGKLKLFLHEPLEALRLFHQGLKIDPNHSLLLLERGLLLIQLGKKEAGLADLNQGRIYHREKTMLYQKYQQAIVEHPVTQTTFDVTLRECAKYAQTLGKKKTCFISYAWNNPEHENWVERLAEDLEKAGFQILFDRWFTRKGHETMDFVEKIMAEDTDYILVVGTKLYLEKYNYQAKALNEREHVLRVEARLINHLIGFNHLTNNKIIPVLLEGTPEQSLPPLTHPKNIVDFTKEPYRPLLLELIRDMYLIDQNDTFFKKLILEYNNSSF